VRRLALHLGCCALALGVAAPALAQDTGDAAPPTPAVVPPPADGTPAAATEQKIVYTPLDFAQYAPRSALDMLQQVPGFNIQESFGQGRGLGEATGNVLLNGERVSSKSDSVTQRLSRIAAANVIRIEFVDGATLDIPGLSGRVANIITGKEAAGVRGQFEWSPQLPTDFAGFRWAGARASLTGTRGPVAFTFAVDNNPFYGGTGGPNRITDRFGAVEERFSETWNVSHAPKIGTQLRIDGPGSSVANLSASWQWSWSDSTEDERVIAAPGAPALVEALRSHSSGHNYEIGGDFEFALGPGRLKLIGLESFRTSAFSTELTVDPDSGAPRTGSRFTQASDSGERIGRGEYRWKMLGGDVQLSGEAAFNRLGNVAGLALLRPSGEFVAIPFPSGSGGVTEDRYETILSFGRPLAANLSLQLSIGGEYSKLAQTGADALSRSFKRPKGSFSLAWAPLDGLDVSLKGARKVGQLNFGDFLADVNLSNNNTNESNNELRPQQSWEFDLEIGKSLGPWGRVTANLFYDGIEDYVAIVPLPRGGEAVGNIASARSYGLSLNSTVRLEPLGFRGAKLDIDAQVRESRLLDPVTGGTRRFDRFQPRNLSVALRHDVPGSDWAWGASFRTTAFEPYYRLAEVGLDYSLRDAFGAFVEHKDVFGLTLQARLNNILEQDAVLDRFVYAGPRNRSPVLFHEARRREVGRIVSFVVKGSF